MKSSMAPPALHRRAVLRGLGTAIALPWLEALLPSGRAAGAARAPLPLRAAFLYVPNGVHVPDWTPAADGAGFELPHTLAPLAPFRRHLTVLSGLAHDQARAHGDGPGDHARAAATFLTGVHPLKSEGAVRLARSADQVIAAAIGARTRFRSLELGCERGRTSGQCDSGYSCAYSSNVSWQDATTPAAKETNPRLVFDRLFRGGADGESARARAEREARHRSVLDFVRDDARRLRTRLGAEDRARLEAYETGIRELERRLDLAAAEAPPEVSDSPIGVPDAARPIGVPDDFAEHVDRMSDLIALAFQTDSTRVATFLLANEGSNRSYANLGVPEGHHDLSHHGGDAEMQRKIRDINRFHVERLAYLLARLDAAREGDRTLLDQCMLVYGSGISDGQTHAHHDLPVLLIGGGGGRLDPGRHVRHSAGTPMNDLFLALFERLDVPVAAFGDGRRPLAGV
jgi:hypothetical protein